MNPPHRPSCVINDIHTYNRGIVFEDEDIGIICLRFSMNAFQQDYCGALHN
jgi:hypothetical protein